MGKEFDVIQIFEIEDKKDDSIAFRIIYLKGKKVVKFFTATDPKQTARNVSVELNRSEQTHECLFDFIPTHSGKIALDPEGNVVKLHNYSEFSERSQLIFWAALRKAE